jgi:hypothetical protein
MHRRSLVLLVLIALLAVPAFASHSWGGYHWARTSNPFTLKLYDNIDSVWEPYLQTAVSDWNQSNILDFNVQWQQPLSSQRKCASATGVIEICNEKYGQNGWLGIAGISISGLHITKGYTKLNDTYFAMATYNTPAYRQMVVCQEIAHDFGLDHQDVTFDNANLGSCMDYTNDPDGGAGGASSNDPANTHPNSHDYSEIQTIYSHLDSTTTIAAAISAMSQELLRPRTMPEILNGTDDFGVAIRYDSVGRATDFFKVTGFSADTDNPGVSGDVVHIFWAPDSNRNFKDE